MPTIGVAANSPYFVTFTARDSNGATDMEQISIVVSTIGASGNFQQEGGSQGVVSVEVENFHRSSAPGEHQ